jgi:hypothetical protein
MKAIRPTLCLFLAVLVLVSSTSFMVGMHKCNGEIKNITFLTHAEGCGHQEKMPPCHKAKQQSCCENGDILHEATDFSSQFSNVELQVFAAGFQLAITDVVISIIIPDPASVFFATKFFHYYIPIPLEDRPVSNRVLLI